MAFFPFFSFHIISSIQITLNENCQVFVWSHSRVLQIPVDMARKSPRNNNNQMIFSICQSNVWHFSKYYVVVIFIEKLKKLSFWWLKKFENVWQLHIWFGKIIHACIYVLKVSQTLFPQSPHLQKKSLNHHLDHKLI